MAHHLLAGDTYLVIVENDTSYRYCPARMVGSGAGAVTP
jgi:hypothetical protein